MRLSAVTPHGLDYLPAWTFATTFPIGVRRADMRAQWKIYIHTLIKPTTASNSGKRPRDRFFGRSVSNGVRRVNSEARGNGEIMLGRAR